MVISEQDESGYEKLLGRRLPEFWNANQTRNRAVVDEFWLRLTADWLSEIGSDPALAPELIRVAANQMTGSDRWFRLFDDVIPALNHLDNLGIDSLVLSNWDRSLHDILESKGIYDRFKRVVASLEEGVEKPDPNLFETLIAPLGLHPTEVLHIGDDLHDDIEGGLRAGFHVGYLDRLSTEIQTNWLDSPWNPGAKQLHIRAPRLTDFIEVIASF